MPKVHWPAEVDRSLCGLDKASTQFTYSAAEVTCERCRKLLPTANRTIWDRINDEDYEPPPRPRRSRPVSEYKIEEEVEYKQVNFPEMGVLTPEEQNREREELLEGIRATRRQARLERARLRQIQEEQAETIRQLRREGEAEMTRLEVGRAITREMITDYLALCRRDLALGVIVFVLAMLGVSVLVEFIASVIHLISSVLQTLAHWVHTWLTAHK